MTTVRRFDRSEPIGMRHGARVDERTGFLHAQIRPTRTGIMVYRLADGSISRELKHPDDVFEPASLETLKRVVITRGHPRDERGRPVDVTAATVNELKKGHAGSTIERDKVGDEEHPIIDATVTDAETVAAIKAGLDQVSMGYSVKVTNESGVWNGQPYDRRHREIRYDHLAVALPMGGRGGSTVSVLLDEADGELVVDADTTTPTTTTKQDEPTTMGTIRITLDDVGLDIDPTLWTTISPAIAKRDQAIAAAAEAAKAAAGQIATLEAARDQAVKDRDAAKKLADEAAAKAPAPAAIKETLVALATARQIVALDAKVVDEILVAADPVAATHRATVLTACADEADALKGKSADYFAARFDVLARSVRNTDDTAPVARALMSATATPAVNAASQKALDEALHPTVDPLSLLDGSGLMGVKR